MQKILITSILLVALAALPLYATDIKAPVKNYPALTGNEPLPPAPYYPSDPQTITQSPGDTAGYTQYDYQTNGSTGNRVAVDGDGNVHVAWMKGMPYPSQRRVYFNCKSYGEWTFPGTGSPARDRNLDGYTSIAVTNDNLSAVVFHNSTAESLVCAIDAFTCLGSFTCYSPWNRVDTFYGIWPVLSVDHQNRLHMTSTTYYGSMILYNRSSDGGNTWTSPVQVDTNVSISAIVTSSRVSDKTAIVYLTENPDNMVSTTYDVYYIQSTDGVTWDWRDGKVNVTNYGPDEDSLSAGSDVDAVYDYNDNLHIIWNAHWVSGGYYYYLSWLYHYSSSGGTITEIIRSDSLWPSGGCDFGGWNWHYCKMSIGADTLNRLYLTYTDFDTSDCSLGGYANGDIYCHASSDGGATWIPRINLTNSQTPLCDPGDCDSDNWSTLAEKVNSDIHLFYVNDKDAGGLPQSEGSVTNNPMLYHHVPTTQIWQIGVDDNPGVPRNFALSQNYPNPFNAQTKISFSLAGPSDIKLEIYDIKGSYLTTLSEGRKDAGDYSVTWDATEVASGVYYCRLTTENGSLSRKMVLIR